MVELVKFLQPLILAAGLLFIMTGLNILITENSAYVDALTALYQMVMYIFYIYLAILLLGIVLMIYEWITKKKH